MNANTSVLGPPVFLLDINDIRNGLNLAHRLFAGDTISYLIVKSNAGAKQLQCGSNSGAWSFKHECKSLSMIQSLSPVKFEYTLHGHNWNM